MQKLKLNTWTGIFDIFNSVILFFSFFIVIAASLSKSADGVITFLYVFQWSGVVLHIIALVRSRKNGISIVGPVLGLVGCALAGFTYLFALPSLVLVIIATVYLFLQKPGNQPKQSNPDEVSNTSTQSNKIKFRHD